jgi:poly-gamma-glutamate capsule biosynthesis protein CapA/YwtB (metallophosphatase superfamily)
VKRRLAPLAAGILLALVLASAAIATQTDTAIKDPSQLDPHRPLAAELRTNVPDGFTVSAVGDLIIARPLSQYASGDPGFAAALNVLAQSDVVYGNMESTILDLRTFKGSPYSFDGDWTNSSLPGVAADLAKMHVAIVSRANNHALDWGIEGMDETSRYLDRAGIAYAGVGSNLGLARAAGYLDSPKARVGIVSFASTYRPDTNALPAQDETPGRPGLSPLHVDQVVNVDAESMRHLAAVACETQRTSCGAPPSTLSLFGSTFRVAGRFGYSYVVDPEDLHGILRSVRDGKQNGDFLIATIHAHECSRDCDGPDPMLAAGFLQDVAHRAIDAGADEFVTTGIHNLGPIEIYKGRPVFYGLANFFWSDIQVALPHDLFQQNAASLGKTYANPGNATAYDLAALLNTQSFAYPYIFQTVIAKSVFERNRLARIVLYAVDLGYGRKLTSSGTPRLADAATARIIFKRIADATREYGLPPLDMRIDGNVATILP